MPNILISVHIIMKIIKKKLIKTNTGIRLSFKLYKLFIPNADIFLLEKFQRVLELLYLEAYIKYKLVNFRPSKNWFKCGGKLVDSKLTEYNHCKFRIYSKLVDFRFFIKEKNQIIKAPIAILCPI